ncbi:MAG TPA: hypothetical protein VF037_12225 [Gemmatimonadales bacterium]
MRRALCSRITTLLLALMLAGGGSGLPLVDAALHHLHGIGVGGTRLSDGESGTAHGDRCTLGVAAPAIAGPVSPPAVTVEALQQWTSVTILPPPAPPSDAPAGSAQPRAPPAFG